MWDKKMFVYNLLKFEKQVRWNIGLLFYHLQSQD